ncbi:MAG TPA: LysM peptidoglycan-binding domain-containing protein, partial [Anaerolineales bacterium]|nr:LysM peptidoglycan-binding domain-containing protein [Anaerolineales bacterium]
MRIARLAGYLLLNMAVSAAVAIAVLLYWENNRQPVASRAPDAATGESGGASPVMLDGSPRQHGLQLSTEPIIYRVHAGDTMGSIAMQYDLTIEELMAQNGLNDPNALTIDQLLTIPARQPVQLTQRPMATRAPVTVVVSPQPPAAVATSSLPPVITIRAVDGVGDLATEQVVIVNVGGAVDLANWALVQPEGDAYRFPVLRLHQT